MGPSAPAALPTPRLAGTGITPFKAAGSSSTKQEDLDLISLLKASHAIAQEVQPVLLMTQILRVAVEHAGASRGVLILDRAGEMWVEAELDAIGGQVTVESHRLAESVRVPKKIVFFVYRKSEAVHFERANQADDVRFADDPYLARPQVRAILCAPIELERRCTGVLYLENDAAEGSLTKGSLEVLRILATQAAISLRNAFHIERLERAHVDLTRRNVELEVQRKAVAALSVPLIEVGEGLMVIPLIGVLDSDRMGRVTTSLLEEVGHRQTRIVLVDVTGIDAVDGATARHLVQLSQMLKLLGSRMLLTGVRAGVAQSILKWGHDLAGLESYATLKGALMHAQGQQPHGGSRRVR